MRGRFGPADNPKKGAKEHEALQTRFSDVENAPPVGTPARRGSARRKMAAAEGGGLRDQPGLEKDLVGRDLADAEEIKQVGAMEEGEEIAGGFVLEGRPRVAVDVAHELVDVGLRQMVEGGALGQDHADELVVALDAGLLVGGALKRQGNACLARAGVLYSKIWPVVGRGLESVAERAGSGREG